MRRYSKFIAIVILVIPSIFFLWRGCHEFIQYRKIQSEYTQIEDRINEPLKSTKAITNSKKVMEILEDTESVDSFGLITVVDTSTVPAKVLRSLKINEIGSIKNDSILDVTIESKNVLNTLYYLSNEYLFYENIDITDKTIELRILVKGE